MSTPIEPCNHNALRNVQCGPCGASVFYLIGVERSARLKAEERARELEGVISGCVLCSSPDTRWDEAMARYRAALTTDPPKEG
jgi:hypothetical protein